MSFALTAEMVRARTKTVTRRLGWYKLKEGDELQAIVQGQGLHKGQRVEKLAVIRVVRVRLEPLNRLVDDLDYGFVEIAREGFENHPVYRWPSTFVTMFCSTHKCQRDAIVNRIEFTYV